MRHKESFSYATELFNETKEKKYELVSNRNAFFALTKILYVLRAMKLCGIAFEHQVFDEIQTSDMIRNLLFTVCFTM